MANEARSSVGVGTERQHARFRTSADDGQARRFDRRLDPRHAASVADGAAAHSRRPGQFERVKPDDRIAPIPGRARGGGPNPPFGSNLAQHRRSGEKPLDARQGRSSPRWSQKRPAGKQASRSSHKLRLVLGHRRTLKRKLLDIENEIRHSLKVFGLMVGPRVQRASFEARVRELVAGDALIAGVTECMLRAWAALWTEYKRLHQGLVQIVGRDELCRRFCHIPGVGPVTALSVKAAIDDPRRFVKSKTVGAHFGLTSRRIQTGDSIDIEGRISKCGDGEVRTVLYEAASAMLVRSTQWCSVKAWGMRIAAKRGHKRAVVAVARKLAVIMHRMWLDGSEFRFSAAAADESSNGASKTTALAAAC
jgi:Transposase IS116/IS110/IS902 family